MHLCVAVPDAWTIAKVLDWTRRDFAARSLPSPRLDAEVLVAHALGIGRVDLYIRYDQPLTDAELGAIRARIERRRQREPVAYILGEREFYGRLFAVDRRVLVPRPETEGVVEAVLDLIPAPSSDATVRVLDVGTGSGAIAVTLATARPDLLLDAVDVSAEAAEVASVNAARYGVQSRVRVLVGSLFAPVATERYHAVVSNPPYIRSAEIDQLMPDVREYEPRLALDGGAQGDAVLVPFIHGAREHLWHGGILVAELSHDQADRARETARQAGYVQIEVRRDLAGIERVLVAHAEG